MSTIKDVAEAAGVSIKTVSRVLNNVPTVRESNRQKVLKKMAELNYRPNIHAQQLKGKRSRTIGLAIPADIRGFQNPFYSEFILSVGTAAAQHSYSILLRIYPLAQERETYLELIESRGVDGVIVVRLREDDPRLRLLRDCDVPFIAYGEPKSEKNVAYIDIDNEQAQYAMAQHLISLGHRHIAYISASPQLLFSQYRQRGFVRAMADHDLTVHPEWLLSGYELTEAGGYRAAQNLFAGTQMPSAVMATTDVMALGIMRYLQERGIAVGGEVSVTGFDDVPAAAHTSQSLTTVHQPIQQIGRELTETLLQMIRDDEPETASKIFEPRLVLRESAQPHNHR